MHYNFKNLLFKGSFLQKEGNESVYYKLFDSLKSVILAKEIPDNFKLPPSRVLASDLNLSRGTVIKAYELLLIEKLIVSRQGSGYFTNKIENTSKVPNKELATKKHPGIYPKISKLGKSFIQNSEYYVGENYLGTVCFRPGLPPLDIFPAAVWQKLSNQYWKSIKYSELSYSDSLGIKFLRKNISNYLKIYRNIDCDPDQIVVTSGSLHSLSLVATAILNPRNSVILENPTYKKAYNLFKSLKAEIHMADLNDDEFNIATLEDIETKLLYVIPSNQYPSGKRMSLKRRQELLDYATSKNILIVEDDYDHEFSNWEEPISSMFSLDINDSVVYLGTFNKLLHPSLRLGYMIIPKFMISPITAISKQTFRFISPNLQSIMAMFISQDYLNKHLRQVMKVSNLRKDAFIEHFESLFKGEIDLEINNSGLHIIGILKDHVKDFQLCNYLLENDIHVHPLSSYYIEDKSRNGLVMGYCSVNKTLIRKNLNRMHKLYLNYLKETTAIES
ncbi:MocR-like pyridoxine biosynthesis transcription factor PdxR [Gelidibacter japonicus]|uniref:MocR-like pyridoxine biosynthesis transcription factor PdxR n=1 Tax=Gelidibacter japonicus TaxID=1962232 RepID=UPI0021CE3FB0|nr:PLP-dependent aminotransferase family protein [Gelidibacter japonicus]